MISLSYVITHWLSGYFRWTGTAWRWVLKDIALAFLYAMQSAFWGNGEHSSGNPGLAFSPHKLKLYFRGYLCRNNKHNTEHILQCIHIIESYNDLKRRSNLIRIFLKIYSSIFIAAPFFLSIFFCRNDWKISSMYSFFQGCALISVLLLPILIRKPTTLIVFIHFLSFLFFPFWIFPFVFRLLWKMENENEWEKGWNGWSDEKKTKLLLLIWEGH